MIAELITFVFIVFAFICVYWSPIKRWILENSNDTKYKKKLILIEQQKEIRITKLLSYATSLYIEGIPMEHALTIDFKPNDALASEWSEAVVKTYNNYYLLQGDK